MGHRAELGQKGQEEVLVPLLGEMTSSSCLLPLSEVSIAPSPPAAHRIPKASGDRPTLLPSPLQSLTQESS